MKLNSTQIERALGQFDAQVLADDHPAVAQLTKVFGQHTFFLDDKGLNVLELIETPQMEPQGGEMINIADWSDATLTKLRAHAPEPTGVVVSLKEIHH
ncbi:hypothetical protein [Bradyrhizobium sp.]|jgi:hypothetical protein|uniref:hypothetical protein n=1 Tax=Bradyrhizobium sp. TaxID=376 RepID=UPI001EC92C7C|nr:hypothetical protein [Bradyrhizobium sp.]MBV8923681.1 hypothetical protein [Bradyrhizobium sp.]MBV9981782.1 hypothetical protein [Bradyrhizobium sp.]